MIINLHTCVFVYRALDEHKIQNNKTVVGIKDSLEDLAKVTSELQNSIAPSVNFAAYYTGTYTIESDQILKFGKCDINYGDGFDLFSGMFTAPESGIFFFNVNKEVFVKKSVISHNIQFFGKNRCFR